MLVHRLPGFGPIRYLIFKSSAAAAKAFAELHYQSHRLASSDFLVAQLGGKVHVTLRGPYALDAPLGSQARRWLEAPPPNPASPSAPSAASDQQPVVVSIVESAQTRPFTTGLVTPDDDDVVITDAFSSPSHDAADSNIMADEQTATPPPTHTSPIPANSNPLNIFSPSGPPGSTLAPTSASRSGAATMAMVALSAASQSPAQAVQPVASTSGGSLPACIFHEHPYEDIAPLGGDWSICFSGEVFCSDSQKDPFRKSSSHRFAIRNIMPDAEDSHDEEVVVRPAWSTEGADLEIYFKKRTRLPKARA
ncbi:hypothetical protein Rt10032_c03g1585 [Rhodotorula toruloides]|uniref:Uncharacterized protein n=1 Tax=Rhodotorula toruloides TaxID=5286 RepID=A0A511KB09_RHOTO|nr:hypothetical protein Rt10032_c03g1585 [Rhodotorula toruloides]